MPKIFETRLPGVGIRFDFVSSRASASEWSLTTAAAAS